ncbi:hypothetical protein GCM10011506_17800 [Marivirga lumbricoides]|uniref:Uncharacterized protein n=1 Tax=Marivirga lumbricoides TaxID=1046115 RepID=A0A2T4DMN1_9BACT|nr:hypothetical protein C9994_11615 [Marivirga lumbricoides]GGC32765.1 hypothetical protein GCM10011506_17800 [Marivirga lumbricoides]
MKTLLRNNTNNDMVMVFLIDANVDCVFSINNLLANFISAKVTYGLNKILTPNKIMISVVMRNS